MIYEMFKALAVNGLGWWEFAFAVVVTVLVVHLLSWAAGALVSAMYKYVQDGAETIDNFMWTLWGKVWKCEEVEQQVLLNGWYKSADIGQDEYWKYREYKDSKETDRCDTSRGGRLAQPCPEGFKRLEDKVESKQPNRAKHILIGTPFYVAVTFLIFDLLPVLVISIASIYAVLRLTRTVVRISKRVTKVEEVTTVSDEADA